MITTAGFSELARFTGRAGGIGELAIAEYPGPLGIHDGAEIAANIENTLVDRVVSGLTRAPRTGGGTAAPGARDPQAVVFAGTYEDVARHFEARGWSDGLPFVPPTPARIERFFEYTDRGADEEIAVLPSANLRATPRVIAANAVMAGCAPEHMPLIVAAVEALGDERASLNNIGSSSAIFPYVLVNGPIVRELAIACGPQLVSRWPNPALGRAIGLIVRNVAGFRPGESYMGTFGYPLAIALAENEAQSPWDPFHVDQGLRRDESAVTIGVTNNWGSAPAPYDTPELPGAKVALDLICREIIGKTRLFHFPARGPDAEHVMLTVLLSPPVAQSLAAAGYSKRDVQRYVYETTRMRLGDYEWVLRYTNIATTTLEERVAAGVLPPEFLGDRDSSVRVLSSPDIVHIVVCGDPHRNRLMVMEGGHTRPTTRPVKLPRNWAALRARDGGNPDNGGV